MLAIFPLFTFIIFVVLLVNRDSQHDWRRSFLRAALLWGSWLIIITEILSLVSFITQIGLLIAWLIPTITCTAWLIVLNRKRRLLLFPNIDWLRAWQHILCVIILLIVLSTTALVAWLAPPNTTDSLNYHMPRVAHWAQERSVAHFTTGIEQQNSRQPMAEFAILHFYVLVGDDRLANFVEWFAMLGCIIGVSLIAGILGAGVFGQLLASIFAATLPMGIVQASSTMTDYVVALWVIYAAAELLALWKDKDAPQRTVLYMALAAGLGIATKPTAAAYLLPFAVAAPILLFHKVKLIKFIKLVMLALIIFVFINAGYSLRNLQTYGSLIDHDQASIHSNELHDWRALLSNMLRNAGMQASTPWGEYNYQITRLVVGVHFKMGLDVNDPRTTAHGEFWVRPLTTSENITPNPLHAHLILVVFLLTLIKHRDIGKKALFYQLFIILGFFIFSFIFKWQIFGSRYLLPFFILYAPLAGLTFSKLLPQWLNVLFAISLVSAASFWLVGIQERPIIPLPGTSSSGSVLTRPREQLYFTTMEDTYPYFKNIADVLSKSGCNDVGMVLSGAATEYIWWLLLDSPNNQIRLEWMIGGASYKYIDQSFTPCAIIADDVFSEGLYNLPLALTDGPFSLYINSIQE